QAIPPIALAAGSSVPAGASGVRRDARGLWDAFRSVAFASDARRGTNRARRCDSSQRDADFAAACAAGLRAALLASVWVGASAMSVPANAQVSGTWTGPGAEWTTGTNWSSNPTVPDNIATFTNNGSPTSVTISSTPSIGTIQFNAAAPAYSFTVN